jgi:Fur family ferric uptake transcriptional regulator
MDIKKKLESKNLRLTKCRVRVMECLNQAEKPKDVAEILAGVNRKEPNFDQATVYRTLDTLVEVNLVKQVDFREGKYRYEIEHEHHHHLVCTKCGRVQPIHEACLSIDERKILSKYKFRVSDHHLEFFGLCDKCLS